VTDGGFALVKDTAAGLAVLLLSRVMPWHLRLAVLWGRIGGAEIWVLFPRRPSDA